MHKPDLAGKRILVVEDEFVLAADICAKIEACRGVVVGPVSTLAGGHALLQTGPQPEGSILDIRVCDDMVSPVADDLMVVGVPIIFASSESKAAIPSKYATIPLIGKPIIPLQFFRTDRAWSDLQERDAAVRYRQTGQHGACG